MRIRNQYQLDGDVEIMMNKTDGANLGASSTLSVMKGGKDHLKLPAFEKGKANQARLSNRSEVSNPIDQNNSTGNSCFK